MYKHLLHLFLTFIQKLEENVLSQKDGSGNSFNLHDSTSGSSRELASRVREIVTRNLADSLDELSLAPPVMSSTARAFKSLQVYQELITL